MRDFVRFLRKQIEEARQTLDVMERERAVQVAEHDARITAQCAKIDALNSVLQTVEPHAEAAATRGKKGKKLLEFCPTCSQRPFEVGTPQCPIGFHAHVIAETKGLLP